MSETLEQNAGPASRTPWHLWVVGVVALLFNSIGAFDFAMNQIQGSSYLAAAGMTPAQVEHYQEMPAWMILVWAVGVWGAFLASVLLLLRRRLAFATFAVSLAAFLVSLVYTYVLTDGGAIMGSEMTIANVVITAITASPARPPPRRNRLRASYWRCVPPLFRPGRWQHPHERWDRHGGGRPWRRR
jgi:hypothetical protein